MFFKYFWDLVGLREKKGKENKKEALTDRSENFSPLLCTVDVMVTIPKIIKERNERRKKHRLRFIMGEKSFPLSK